MKVPYRPVDLQGGIHHDLFHEGNQKEETLQSQIGKRLHRCTYKATCLPTDKAYLKQSGHIGNKADSHKDC